MEIFVILAGVHHMKIILRGIKPCLYFYTYNNIYPYLQLYVMSISIYSLIVNCGNFSKPTLQYNEIVGYNWYIFPCTSCGICEVFIEYRVEADQSR